MFLRANGPRKWLPSKQAAAVFTNSPRRQRSSNAISQAKAAALRSLDQEASGIIAETTMDHQSNEAQVPDKTLLLQTEYPWGEHTCLFEDLERDSNSPLARRRGVTALLNLVPLTRPPGMVFDLPTQTLSVNSSFPGLQYARDATHHTIKPWVKKAFIQRAEAWQAKDLYDFQRVKRNLMNHARNRTTKIHRGMSRSNTSFMMSMAQAVCKGSHPFAGVWPVNLGPTLPSRWLGHLDGMEPGDAIVYTETHGQIPELSSILVAVNSSFYQAQAAWTARVLGKKHFVLRPDHDAFTPLMNNFAQWLHETFTAPSKRIPSSKNLAIEGGAAGPLPRLASVVPEGHVVPVIFAFRHQYVWFLWSGGIQGRLEAQYASHWLPMFPGKNYAHRTWLLQEQTSRTNPREARDVPATSITTVREAGATGESSWTPLLIDRRETLKKKAWTGRPKENHKNKQHTPPSS